MSFFLFSIFLPSYPVLFWQTENSRQPWAAFNGIKCLNCQAKKDAECKGCWRWIGWRVGNHLKGTDPWADGEIKIITWVVLIYAVMQALSWALTPLCCLIQCAVIPSTESAGVSSSMRKSSVLCCLRGEAEESGQLSRFWKTATSFKYQTSMPRLCFLIQSESKKRLCRKITRFRTTEPVCWPTWHHFALVVWNGVYRSLLFLQQHCNSPFIWPKTAFLLWS